MEELLNNIEDLIVYLKQTKREIKKVHTVCKNFENKWLNDVKFDKGFAEHKVEKINAGIIGYNFDILKRHNYIVEDEAENKEVAKKLYNII